MDKRWTKAEKLKLKEILKTESCVYKISKQMGRSKGAVYKMLDKLGYKLEKRWTR